MARERLNITMRPSVGKPGAEAARRLLPLILAPASKLPRESVRSDDERAKSERLNGERRDGAATACTGVVDY